MKKHIQKISLFVFMVLAAVSCRDESLLPVVPFDDLEKGAFARLVELRAGTFDLFALGTAQYSATVEFDDDNSGQNVAEYRVYASFDGAQGMKAEQLAKTYSSFTVGGERGLPRTDITFTPAELISLLNLDESLLDGGDVFNMRAEIVMNDGRVFGGDNSSANLVAEPPFNSLFNWAITVVCEFDSALWTGDYQMTTTGLGIFATPTFTDGVVTFEEGATSTSRTFVTRPYPAFGVFSERTFTINFICGDILMADGQATGVGCGSSTLLGTSPNVTTYDANNIDDSSFTLNFLDDIGGASCGAEAAGQVVFTKL